MAVTGIDQPGRFYLGQPYDLETRSARPEPLLYEARDLLTHAVCVGMTGSGKTGLCVTLLEEAALAGLPALVIDPKGDIGNLLLAFPDVRGEDLEPWVDAEEAARRGIDVATLAAEQAERWRAGLAASGQDGARVRRLTQAAEFTIYTPGSRAGAPLSVLRSFSAPAPALRDDADALRERVTTTASSLLGLLGIDADPLRSREHILVASLLQRAWLAGQDLDLGALIGQITTPPLQRVGVMDVDSFFPPAARGELALLLNNLLAAPGFDAWMEGAPLDVGALLRTPEGRPRVSILSIAHLTDSERMMFVSMLLGEVLGWVRTQSGTSSLRALLYMDEIFGYFPPVANPPSKPPLLTLLKQARAFGLGLVLATQNPVDLDYKGLSNTGTWFIGRLQTERDKMRVIEGLEGASVGAQGFDRGRVEAMLAGLGSRVFLMNDVHRGGFEVMTSRWAMSYLRGPLTRDQIRRLTNANANASTSTSTSPSTSPSPSPSPSTSTSTSTSPSTSTSTSTSPSASPAASGRPALAPSIPEFFVPVAPGQGGPPLYVPYILGAARVTFAHKTVTQAREVAFMTAPTDAPVAVRWEDAIGRPCELSELLRAPEPDAHFAPLPAAAQSARSYPTFGRAFVAWLLGHQRLELWQCEEWDEVSHPGEDEASFRARVTAEAQAHEGERLGRVRARHDARRAPLEARLRRAEDNLARQRADVTDSQVDTAASIGESVLGALLGRRRVVPAARRSARNLSRVSREKSDVARAEAEVASARARLEALDVELRAGAAAAGAPVVIDRLQVAPKKSAIVLELVALVWVPTGS